MAEVPDIRRIHDVEEALQARVTSEAAALPPREVYDCVNSLFASLMELTDLVAEVDRQCSAIVSTAGDSKLKTAESYLQQATGQVASFCWDLGRAVGAEVKVQKLGDTAPRRAEPGD